MSGQGWLDALLAPARCVLIVVDKQRWYLDPEVSPFLKGTDRTVAQSEVAGHDRLIETARRSGVPVVWTSMTEGDDDAPANVAAKWDRRPDEPRLRRADPGHGFAGLGPNVGEPVLDKVYPSAFAGTDLEQVIADLGRRTAVIIGSYAGRCVLATAFGAQEHGMDVMVLRGLAEAHPWHHEEEQVALAVIDSIVGYVLEPSTVLSQWPDPDR